MRRDNVNIIVLSVCMAAVTLAAVLIGYSFGSANAAAPAAAAAPVTVSSEEAVSAFAVTEEPPQVAESLPVGSIAVPGFERLTAEGGTLHAATVGNPAENTCFFVVAVLLPDGTEVYRSSYLSPGQSLGDVKLSQDVAAGTYEGAVARYSCFSTDDMRQLNGADIAFTLEVLP